MYISAFWGNSVIASIRVSKAQWKLIQEGKKYEADCSYYDEGKKYTAYWTFKKKCISITASDGNECINQEPICVLNVIAKTERLN